MLKIQSPDLYMLNGINFDKNGNIYFSIKYREKSALDIWGIAHNFIFKVNENNGEFKHYNENTKSLKIKQEIKNLIVAENGYSYFFTLPSETKGGLYTINDTGTSLSDISPGYDLLSIENRIAWNKLVAKLTPNGEIFIAGDYNRWTISDGNLIFKTAIAIDSKDFLAIKENYEQKSEFFFQPIPMDFRKLIQLDESYYLQDASGDIYLLKEDKLILFELFPNKLGQTLFAPTLSNVTNNNNKYIFAFYSDTIRVSDFYVIPQDNNYYIKKYDVNLKPIDFATLSYKNSHIVDAWSTADGELIVALKQSIPKIINGLPIYSDQYFIEKFDYLGVKTSTLSLDFEVSSLHYNSFDDSIYAIENNGITNWNFSSLSNHSILDDSIKIHKINNNLILDANFTTPEYINSTRYSFNGKYFAQDINGNAGITAKILGAVFGKDSINKKQYVGIGLDLLDKGMDYTTLAGFALTAAGLITNDQIVSTLWKNIVGTTATAEDKAPFVNMLENGMIAGDLAKLAAETPLNTTNINLVGLISTGLEYLPVN